MFIEIVVILLLLSGLILFLVLVCNKKGNKPLENIKLAMVTKPPKTTKLAIVSMVTKQPDFDFWLEYHLEHLGFDIIFLRVEDSPEYKPLIQKYGNRIIASFHDKKDINTKNNYQTIMDRQKELVNSSIKKSKELGIDYLFHIDADELIYVGSKRDKNSSLKKYLNNVEPKYSCIHFKNFEGIFKQDNKSCFNTNRFIDCEKGSCLSYANGKSAGRIIKNIKFHGPHFFSGPVYNMPSDKISVLHFDSCTYDQWLSKFDRLKDTSEKKLKEIPFGFYKDSIKNLQECGGSKKHEPSCDFKLKKYYNSHKVNTNKKYEIINY